jgi:hypothetical protein
MFADAFPLSRRLKKLALGAEAAQPVHSSLANESILRVSAPKRLLQHYLPVPVIRACGRE